MVLHMFRWLQILSLFLFVPFCWAQNDRSGSSDYSLLQRFPLSYIESYEQREVPEYRLILGGIAKINGVVTPESEQRLSGLLTRITYRIPDGYRSDEPFVHFRNQLLRQGGEVIFQCGGRDCGSSNYWANAIFRTAKLYGVDRTQNYLAARVGQTYFALYTMIRGNKRVYAHLEVLQAGQDDFITSLGHQGYVRLPETGELPESLLEYLRSNPDQQFWLVGFDRKQGSVQAGIDRSLKQVEALKELLLQEQVGAERIHLHGVGPLAPLMVGEGEVGIYIILE